MKRINILHLITDLGPAGAENLLLNIARHVDQERFRMVVGYIYGSGTLASEIGKADIKVVDLSRGGNIDPWLIIRLILLIKRERIEIIHTHLVHASIAGRIAGKLAGVKNIVTTRHYAYYHKEKGLVNWIERRTAIFNNRFIAISNAVKKYMVERENYEPEKITVIYNAVDMDLFDTRDSEINRRKNDDFLIGSVGRLDPSKGYDTLLRSMPAVIREFPMAKLMVMGDGAQRKYLEELCANLGIAEQVTFLGRKTPAEVRGFLEKIDLFVLASHWEGFGVALIEAMSAGKPVVATQVGGIPEIVDDGGCGFLVPPCQPQVLADKIVSLLRDRELSLEMGKKGRKRAETLFSLDRMMAELENVYRGLLNHR
jgi:glycosyltransferase involved in cell wall biosynthesis